MTVTNATNFRKNVFEYLANAIVYNDPVQVTTKDGNAVVLSQDEYQGLLATVELLNTPGMKDKLQADMNTPIEECVPADEVNW